MQGGIVYGSPDRRGDAVVLPDLPICEADLTADWLLAARHSPLANAVRDAIGLGKRKALWPFGKRQDLPPVRP